MLEISAGVMTASLAPKLGGVVMRLSHDGRDLLRPACSADAVAEDPREAACFPCVPWFSRLAGGLDFEGRHYDLAPTLPACDPHHALHGEGWINPWKVTAQTQDGLECRFDHRPRPGKFPFAFSATQTFAVTERAFAIDLTVTNKSDTPMPAGLGLHPYFPRLDATLLRATASRCWAADDTGNWRETPMPAELNFSAPRALPSRDADEALIGWDGELTIAAEKTIRMTSSARLIHVFAPAGADFFCLEPLTQAPACFGETILPPNGSLDLSMTISV